MTDYQFPKWEELPDLDLYLDQVLFYVNKVMTDAFGTTDKALTAAMINNYVKHAHIPKPIKKKYNRSQIARLIALTCLKPVFPIAEIIGAINYLSEEKGSQVIFDEFVACMNGEEKTPIETAVATACQTVKLFHKTRQLALELEREDNHELHA